MYTPRNLSLNQDDTEKEKQIKAAHAEKGVNISYIQIYRHGLESLIQKGVTIEL